MAQIERACRDLVFFFNKKHLEDSTIPMWVVTANGESYYVNHVDATIPWSTKERPDNPSTKGSLKFKDCLLVINDDNEATINVLTEHDKVRLRNREKGITRILTTAIAKLRDSLKNFDIKHSPIKTFTGECTTTMYVVDILDKSHLTFLTLSMGKDFRILQENEYYYKAYNSPKEVIDTDESDYEDWYDDDD